MKWRQDIHNVCESYTAQQVDDAEGDELDSLGDERPDGSKCCSL